MPSSRLLWPQCAVFCALWGAEFPQLGSHVDVAHCGCIERLIGCAGVSVKRAGVLCYRAFPEGAPWLRVGLCGTCCVLESCGFTGSLFRGGLIVHFFVLRSAAYRYFLVK
jgi:hypothetical protein